jgi:hypothetical protein
MTGNDWLRSSNDDYGSGSIVDSENEAAGGNHALRALVEEAGLSNAGLARAVVAAGAEEVDRTDEPHDGADRAQRAH